MTRANAPLAPLPLSSGTLEATGRTNDDGSANATLVAGLRDAASPSANFFMGSLLSFRAQFATVKSRALHTGPDSSPGLRMDLACSNDQCL